VKKEGIMTLSHPLRNWKFERTWSEVPKKALKGHERRKKEGIHS